MNLSAFAVLLVLILQFATSTLTNRTVSGPVYTDTKITDQSLVMHIQTLDGLRSATDESPSLPEIECIITLLNNEFKQLTTEDPSDVVDQRKSDVEWHLNDWIKKEFMQFRADQAVQLEAEQYRGWIVSEQASLISTLSTHRSFGRIDEALSFYQFVLPQRINRAIRVFPRDSDIARELAVFRLEVDRAVFYWNFKRRDVHGKWLKINFNANMTEWTTRWTYKEAPRLVSQSVDSPTPIIEAVGWRQRLNAFVNRKDKDAYR